MKNLKSTFFIITLVTTFTFSVVPVNAMQYGKGTLLKGEFAEVFLVSDDETLRWIPDEATFNALGYDWDDIITVKNEILYQYKFGKALDIVGVVDLEPVFETPAQIKEKVTEYFSDIPIMIDIAECESGFRQFNDDGTILKSRNGLYVGIFQIDENIHADFAKNQLGMDIYTVDGSMAYARHLYEELGAQPWPVCSKKSAEANFMVVSNLEIGDSSQEVKILQQILNENGFIIAESGPGSPGNETNYFGSLTQAAVRKFQCANDIVCSGSEDTTGYGQTGPSTRAALNSL